jgi:malonyl CoA-acyl carrier protein transacylase/acyl carrier protein
VSSEEALAEPRPGTACGADDEVAERIAILRAIFAETLGIGRADADASFFDLGGNSLLATRLIARVRSRLGAELPLSVVFEARTPTALAGKIEQSVRGLRPPIERLPHNEVVPLAPAQRRLWFLNRLDRDVGTYNMPVAYRLRGQLDVDALRGALGDVVARHESLRTVYPDWDGPRQVILSAADAAVDLPVREIDEAVLLGALTDAAAYPFDVTIEIPVRAELFRLAADEHVLLLVIHHISCDGWSLVPLGRDLARAYSARRVGRPSELPELAVQYADFALWQQQLLEPSDDGQAMVNRQTAFWRAELAGRAEPSRLDGLLPRPSPPSNRGHELLLRIPAQLHQAILALARRTGTSAFMIVHSAVAIALVARGAGDDVVIGAPAAGRTDSVLDELVGFFVNTVLLRLDCGGDPRFIELLGRACATDLAAFAHQDVPFDHLVRELNPPRTPGWPPLFNVMLTFQNTGTMRLELPGLDVLPERVPQAMARFDLRFEFVERLTEAQKPDGIDLTMTHALDVCPEETAQRLAGDIVGNLAAAVAHPGRRISRIGLPIQPDEDLGENVGLDKVPRLPADYSGRTRIAFVCSPYGQQWLGMGRTMYQDEPTFRAAMDECDAHVARHAGWSVVDELFADEATVRIDDVSVWQPVVFALQVALCRWLESRGVTPDAVVGHSLGELAACVISGILDLSDAALLVRHYTVQQRRIAGSGGGMVVAELSAAQMREHLDRLGSELCIATQNGPRTTVIAGPQDGLDRLLADLRSRDVLCAQIRVDLPAHSPAIDAILPDLVQSITDITPRPPRLPMISSVFGRALNWREVGPDYFAWNLRRPVLLADATRHLLVDEQFAALVEVSANPILESALLQSATEADRGALVFTTMRRSDADDAAGPRRLLDELAAAGYVLDTVSDGGERRDDGSR